MSKFQKFSHNAIQNMVFQMVVLWKKIEKSTFLVFLARACEQPVQEQFAPQAVADDAGGEARCGNLWLWKRKNYHLEIF